MREKLGEAAKALRAVGDECALLVAACRELADRLDGVGNTRPTAATRAARPRKPARPRRSPRGAGTHVSTKQVFAIVAGGAGLTHDDIAAKVGRKDVRYQLKKLEVAGRVTCGGDKKYRKTVNQAAAVN